MVDTIKSLRGSFTVAQVQHIITLRFGNPLNYAKPLKSFELVINLTGHQQTTAWKMCKRNMQRERIVLGRASAAASMLLYQQESDFLLDLKEIRNFSLTKRAALFNAMFGKRLAFKRAKSSTRRTKSVLEGPAGCSIEPYRTKFS